MNYHKYTPYRPEWCRHPPFESIDYCWGLAVLVDRDLKMFKKKLKDYCEGCEFKGEIPQTH